MEDLSKTMLVSEEDCCAETQLTELELRLMELEEHSRD